MTGAEAFAFPPTARGARLGLRLHVPEPGPFRAGHRRHARHGNTITRTTELGLGCEGHVATGDGSLAPAPDRRHRITAAARANVRLVGSGTTDDVGMDRTVKTDSAGGCAIRMTRPGEGDGRTRPAARWPMGRTDRRQPGRTTTPADQCSGPISEKAEGRRANADPIACLAGRDRCAVLRSSPVR